MNEATVAQTVMTLLILVIFLGLLIWGIKSRQFHDVEDAKYRMLDDRNDINEEKVIDSSQEKQQ
jgi:cbb3-type cytochrome oxidase maturation protein